MEGKVKVFLEKDGKRKEVGVELRVQGARKAFWFVEMKPQPSQQPEGKGDEDQSFTVEEAVESDTEDLVAQSATEDAPGMSEEEPSERETRLKMWLSEKVASLEKENQDLKGALQEMEKRLSLLETTSKQADE